MNNTVLGLDLAKTIFHVVELAMGGKVLRRRKFSRQKLKQHMANLSPTTLAMEACASAHYWGRLFTRMGHQVLLFPPQHVKGYVRKQKNDYNDAQAIAEACLHGAIRAVPIKSVVEQDEQALHRIRQQRVGEQTRLANQIRGLLGEYGIVIPQGVNQVFKAVPRLLEDADNELSGAFRALLNREYQHLLSVRDDLQWCNEQLQQETRQDPVCQRLMALPGFGPVVSSAVKSWMGSGLQFQKGRHASAALGLVPRQHTSGDKVRLMGITKCGDKYTRSLLVNGARSVVSHAKHKSDPLSRWINRLVEDRGFNKAVVALANKLIRIAWVIVARKAHYQPRSEAA